MDGASGQMNTRQKWSTNNKPTVNTDENSEADSEDEVVSFHEGIDSIGTDFSNAIFNEEDEICSLNQKPVSSKSDKNVFGICFVPLQLKSDERVIWSNKTPSSILYCRPIKE